MSRENIAILISIIGLVLSSINFLHMLIVNGRRIKVYVTGYMICDNMQDTPIYFEIFIENRSRLPISISRMFLICGEETFEFSWIPKKIFESVHKSGNEVTSRDIVHSVALPANVLGLGAVGGFFYIDKTNISKENFKKATLQIILKTSKGTKKIKLNHQKLHAQMHA